MSSSSAAASSLYAWRAPALKQGGLFAPISREGALVLNNLLLTTACATVFIGTLYPLALEVLTGEKISVGAPFFNLTFAPLIVPLLIAVPFGPLLAWKRGDLLGAAQRLMVAGIVALVAMALVLALDAMAARRWRRWRSGLRCSSSSARCAISPSAPRCSGFRSRSRCAAARGLPRATWGTAFAHAGLGVALIGIVCETTWNSEYIGAMKPDDVAPVAGYELRLDGLDAAAGAELPRDGRAVHRAARDGDKVSVMTPSKRNFTTRGASTTEAALLTRGASQLYISLGDAVGRRRDRGAHLSQAAGAPDLVGAGADGVRRRAVAVGSPPAGRRAEARARRGARIAGAPNGCGRAPLAPPCSRLTLVLGAMPAHAVQPDEIMADPAKEARARELSRELRCMVCQNQSIDDSEAPLARDLRLLVRERIAAGDSDRAGDRFPGGALWRIRAAEAARSTSTRCCCG